MRSGFGEAQVYKTNRIFAEDSYIKLLNKWCLDTHRPTRKLERFWIRSSACGGRLQKRNDRICARAYRRLI
jgi:hypothetical protein